MHGLPTRTGLEMINRLRSAAEASGISIIPERVAEVLLTGPDGGIRGVEIVRGDGTRERIGCDALILACNGYGGNAISSAALFLKWRMRFISAIQAIAGMPSYGARRLARNWLTSAPIKVTARSRRRTIF